MNYLIEAINNNMVKLQQEVGSWEEAIQLCGALFEKNGIANSEYTQAMIDSAKNNGAYIVITPHIAMPHAKSEFGVQKTGVAILSLKTPVNFGHEEHDPVSLVFALAAKTHEDLEQTLGIMLQLFSDQETIEKINTCQTIKEFQMIVEKHSFS